MKGYDLTPRDIERLSTMPYGGAGEWIRKNVDPLWGLASGDLKSFSVTLAGSLSRKEDFRGTIVVQAEDEKNAEKLAFAVLDSGDKCKQFVWRDGNPLIEDWDDEDWSVLDVKGE